MAPHLGARTRRVEDQRLITGRGHFAADIHPDGRLHVAFCRSSLPHARIRAVDRSVAAAMPGVVAVWAAEDIPEVVSGLSDFGPTGIEQRGRPILNREEVNYVREGFAMVLAETEYQARDAAESVFAEFDPLPVVAGAMNAIADGAPLVHADMTSNVAHSSPTSFGDIKAAFAGDPVVATIT